MPFQFPTIFRHSALNMTTMEPPIGSARVVKHGLSVKDIQALCSRTRPARQLYGMSLRVDNIHRNSSSSNTTTTEISKRLVQLLHRQRRTVTTEATTIRHRDDVYLYTHPPAKLRRLHIALSQNQPTKETDITPAPAHQYAQWTAPRHCPYMFYDPLPAAA